MAFDNLDFTVHEHPLIEAGVDREAAIEIERLEDTRRDYLDAHYGPQWGLDDEEAIGELDKALVAAYDRHNVPQEARLDV